MSMIVYLRRASPADMDALLADPDAMDELFFGDPDQEEVDPNRLIDFDQAWHAVHHMLTGSGDATDSPLSIIVDGNPPVGDRGLGYAEYWVISPDRMRAFASALDMLSDDDLAARYDPVAMHADDVYMSDMFLEDGKDGLDDCMRTVPSLRRFAAECVEQGCGAIKSIG